MKLQEKIKSWCKDEKFMSFAQERARKEVCEVAENHRIDPQYEELDEAFEYDDRYIAPLVTYLTYKLRLALLHLHMDKHPPDSSFALTSVPLQQGKTQKRNLVGACPRGDAGLLRGDILGGVRESFDGTSGCGHTHAAHGICTDVER